jgi:hypothetical protein
MLFSLVCQATGLSLQPTSSHPGKPWNLNTKLYTIQGSSRSSQGFLKLRVFWSFVTATVHVRASPAVLSMWPCKNISHIQILGIYLLPTLSIQLKLGLQIGGRPLVATHLDESNYLVNQKQGAVNKYDLIVFIRLFQGSSRALETVHFSRITAVCQWIHWIWLLHLSLDFQCRATYFAPVEML